MNKKLLLATPLSLMVMFTLPGCDDVDFDDAREEVFEEADDWDDDDDWDDVLKPKKSKARTKPKRSYKPKRQKRSSFSVSSSSRKRR